MIIKIIEMDQYTFWDIIRKITTTIFCISTPYCTEVDVYIPPYIDEISRIKHKKGKIYESKINTDTEGIKNRFITHVPKSCKVFKHKEMELNIIEDLID